MSQGRLNAYRIMWLFVFFDLPTNTKKERRTAQQFRKKLLKDGFTMMQFSVYTRHCASFESATVHINRINSFIPNAGQVSIMQITDKQYGNIQNYWGISHAPLPGTPQQLELF
ncbi:MAG: CRISPR-associated endonuclease Cas2 [Crocinitomix sp.]|nr:CRISPR-associated endonuclease Cas2 [Crocinitomix sp.]